MRIVIIGGSGLIGQETASAGSAIGHQVIATYTTNPRPNMVSFNLLSDDINDLVPKLGPDDFIILLSAYTDPSWIYHHPEESHSLNVLATIRCINDISSKGAHLIFMSSEAVFGGAPNGGHDEESAPNPQTLYARQKLVVENHIKNETNKWAIIRTGWTVGFEAKSRCPIANTYKSLLSGSAKIARDNYFTVTDVRDTVSGLLKVIESGFCGVLHITSNPPISRINLAECIIQNSAMSAMMNYEKVSFSSLLFEEPRPICSWLENKKSIELFNLTYSDSLTAIKQKVAILDNYEV